MCTHPHQKNQKNICPSPKKALTLHSQNRKRRTCSQAKAGQKPTKSQTAKIFFKKSVKNLHSPNKGCNFASLSAREENHFP